jgi:hypothetical protein
MRAEEKQQHMDKMQEWLETATLEDMENMRLLIAQRTQRLKGQNED